MDAKEALMHKGKPFFITATVTLALLALFLLVQTINGLHNWGHPDVMGPGTITVTGEGKATAIPDTATLSFGATATAADVVTAQMKVNTIINAALDGVKGQKVDAKDITTTSFNVSPHYSGSTCQPGVFCVNTRSTIIGYDVSEMVQVKVHDTSKVSPILDALAKANVTNVSGPDYVVNDPQAVMAQARAQAIERAKADAQKLAQQLGVRLGKITTFQDNAGRGGVPPMMKEGAVMSAAVDTAPVVPVGQNQYTDSVSITYEIH